MPEDTQPKPSEIPAPEAELIAGTEQRVNRGMLVFGIAGTIVCLAWGGMPWGGGFAIGAALSAVNFRWMKMAAHALAEAATRQMTQQAPDASGNGPESPPTDSADRPPQAAQSSYGRGVGTAVRFVFRYALIGLAAYAIFINSFISLGAFFAGLFVFIGAILAEVAYQVYSAFRSA